MADDIAFARNVLLVRFHPRATQEARQAAIEAVRGTVIGGSRVGAADGFYLILLPPDPRPGAMDDAERRLTAQSGVVFVGKDFMQVSRIR